MRESGSLRRKCERWGRDGSKNKNIPEARALQTCGGVCSPATYLTSRQCDLRAMHHSAGMSYLISHVF